MGGGGGILAILKRGGGTTSFGVVLTWVIKVLTILEDGGRNRFSSFQREVGGHREFDPVLREGGGHKRFRTRDFPIL